MPALFESAREVLDDLDTMKDSVDTAADAIDIDPEISSGLARLSEAARSELSCMSRPFSP